MDIKLVSLCLMFGVVLADTKSCDEKSERACCQDERQVLTELKRLKRAKYYSSPPPGAFRYYRRPPAPAHLPQMISYTPPPNYMRHEDDMPHPPRPPPGRPPTDLGLGDEDISNIVKYISKQDLDKIIDLARQKDRGSAFYKKSRPLKESEDYQYARQQFNENLNYLNQQSIEIGNEKFALNGPYVSASNPTYKQEDKTNQIEYNNYPNTNFLQEATQNKASYANAPQSYFNLKAYSTSKSPLNTQQNMQNRDPYLNGPLASHVNDQVNNMVTNSNDASTHDTDIAKDESLPRPVNLRDDIDNIEGAHTRKVANVARPDFGYKVEDLGNFPVMNYHSKLFQTSSYNVPHYSITSGSKDRGPSPPVEPAPPPQAARDQSDAHLKAIKIWSHRSQGQAYTLHDDGTLSLERPLRPKPSY